jgi:hypothetical protein
LPWPPTAMTETRWAFRSSVDGWNNSLTRRSSRSRPDEGRLQPDRLQRPEPPGRDAQRAGELDRLGLSLQLVQAGVLVCDRSLRGTLRRLVDEYYARLRGRLDADAVLTAGDQRTREVEVAGQELARVLGVAGLRRGGEADEIGEEHRDDPPLRNRQCRGCRRNPARRGAAPHSPQNFLTARVGGSAGGADRGERRPALAAELLGRRVRGPPQLGQLITCNER